MRIVYGVFGYGRGHATRAMGVLPELVSRHDVLIFAGGDAYDALSPNYSVVRVPAIRFVYDGRTSKRSAYLTTRENFGVVYDALWGGPISNGIAARMAEFRPNLVICDVEPFVHQVAARLGVPRISFDHFGIMAYCRPPVPVRDRLRFWRDVLLYQRFTGKPQKAIVSSFYSAPVVHPGVACVGPLLRDEVLALKPRRGDHLLVYLNNGAAQMTDEIEHALHSIGSNVIIYGTPRRGQDGRLNYKAPSNTAFLEDLASCRAVFSTAGNQLVGEAAFLGKPMLVTPENTVEQRLNAAALDRLQIGMRIAHRDIDASAFAHFFQNESTFRANALRLARDGRKEAVESLERFARELATTSAVRARAFRFA